MGTYICSLLKSSLNTSRRQRKHNIDAVLLMGGNIRGGQDYQLGSFFSLEALEAEIKGDEVIAVVPMPGWLLAEGIAATHSGPPIPGWMQYDSGIQEEIIDGKPVITQVKGEPIDHKKIYRVATKISDLTNGQSPPWTGYYSSHPALLPPKGAYVNVQAELMAYFARNLLRKIWDSLSERLLFECEEEDTCNAEMRMETLDKNRDGIVGIDEIQQALADIGLSVDNRELSLAQFVHSFADTNGSGEVTLDDMQVFCEEMEEIYIADAWRLSSPRSDSSPGVKVTN